MLTKRPLLLASLATLLAAAPAFAVSNASSALAQPIPETHFDAVSFERVIDYLRTTSGANLVVNWKVLETVGVAKDSPITLDVRNVTLRKLTELVLAQAGPAANLVITVDQNVITITTQQEADTHLVTRVYSVEDLVLVQDQNVVAPDLSLTAAASASSSGGGGQSLFTDTNNQSNAQNGVTQEQLGQKLVTVLRSVVRPDIWRDNGGTASIQFLMGKLIVTAPESVQEAIGGEPEKPGAGERIGM